MPTVDITNHHHVLVDGKDAGHFCDALRNLPLAAADLKAAFDVMVIGIQQKARDEVIAARAEHTETLASLDADVEALKAVQVAELAKVQADLDVLGGSGKAEALRIAQDEMAKAARIEAIKAELAMLEKADIPVEDSQAV